MGKLRFVSSVVRVLAASAFVLLCIQVSIQPTSAQTRTEYRAFWVDTFNTLLDNHAQVLDTITRAKQAKANAIFVQVRRRGDSWYINSLEPKAAPPARNGARTLIRFRT